MILEKVFSASPTAGLGTEIQISIWIHVVFFVKMRNKIGLPKASLFISVQWPETFANCELYQSSHRKETSLDRFTPKIWHGTLPPFCTVYEQLYRHQPFEKGLLHLHNTNPVSTSCILLYCINSGALNIPLAKRCIRHKHTKTHSV